MTKGTPELSEKNIGVYGDKNVRGLAALPSPLITSTTKKTIIECVYTEAQKAKRKAKNKASSKSKKANRRKK